LLDFLCDARIHEHQTHCVVCVCDGAFLMFCTAASIRSRSGFKPLWLCTLMTCMDWSFLQTVMLAATQASAKVMLSENST